jgi:hypothetical protein
MRFLICSADQGSKPQRHLGADVIAELGKFMEEAREEFLPVSP